MSSEDKTVEPSDKGPSPPSSSAGATSTGSPAHPDKRPRGRPRKDAAAPLPQAQPSATSKNRKKYVFPSYKEIILYVEADVTVSWII